MKHTGLVLLYTGRRLVATIEVLLIKLSPASVLGANWPETAAEGPLSKALTPDCSRRSAQWPTAENMKVQAVTRCECKAGWNRKRAVCRMIFSFE